jgi:transcriptional regulator with XRE-family HTH domain
MRKNTLGKWRRRLDLTQAELAVLAHCSRATIIWIERLGHYPTPGVRSKLSKALGVSSEAVLWPTLEAQDGK